MSKTGVCVAVRGGEVIVSSTTERRLLAGLAGETFGVRDMLTQLTTGRAMTKWERRLCDILWESCGPGEITVSASGFTVKPLPAVAAEIPGLVGAVAQALRAHLEADEWCIVSQSCRDAAALH